MKRNVPVKCFEVRTAESYWTCRVCGEDIVHPPQLAVFLFEAGRVVGRQCRHHDVPVEFRRLAPQVTR